MNQAREEAPSNDLIFNDLYSLSPTSLDKAKQDFEDPNKLLSLFNLGVFLSEELIAMVNIREADSLGMYKIMNESREALNKDIILPSEKWLFYGILILPEHQGKGYGSELTKRRLKFVFESLGADGVLVDIHPENTASVGLSTKHGFKPLNIKEPWRRLNNLYYLKHSDYKQQTY